MLSGYQNLDTQGNDLWLTEGQTDSYYEYSVNPEGGSDLKSTFYNNVKINILINDNFIYNIK